MFKRKLTKKILPLLGKNRAIVIIGARQVGKTTMLKHLMRNHLQNCVYLDLEFKEYLDLCNRGVKETYEFLVQKGLDITKKMFLAIDEIQYLNDPTKFIKLFVDHYTNVQLLISGSSTFEIKKKFKNSLVGRTDTFTLYPLDFEEFLEFKGEKYSLQKENNQTINQELVPLYSEFVRFGGYPGVVLSKTIEEKKQLINQIINTYILKDIRDIGNIRNVDAFNKLVKILADQTGALINVSDLANTVNLSPQTIEEYLFLLEQTFIIKQIRPYHKNIRTELTKSPKVFFIDTGLMQFVKTYDFPEINGSSFENSVFTELLKNEDNIKYWRTTNKQEIDFIINHIPVEVKLNFAKAKSSAMRYFEDKYGRKGKFVCLHGEKKDKTTYPWELVT